MEVSSAPTNPNYSEGGDYGNRAPNIRNVEAANDPRGDGYPAATRGENYDYSQRQYLPQEREFVGSQGSCSHCQAHCCQRPIEYQNQPAGSRGERLERYVASVRNESVPVVVGTDREVRSRTPVLHGQGAIPHPQTCSSRVEALVANEHHRVPPPQQVTECCSIPDQQSMDRARCHYDTTSNSYHPGQNYVNEPQQYQPALSREERLERYVASVHNESVPVVAETDREGRSRAPVSHGQGANPHPETCISRVEALVANEHHRVGPPPQQVTECCIPYQQSMDRARCEYDFANNSYHPGQTYVNEPRQYEPETVSPSPNPYRMESPFIAEERSNEPTSSSIPQVGPSEPNVVRADPIPHIPQPNTAQSQPILESRGLQTKESVESLMAPRRSNPPRDATTKEEKEFNPSSMTHLNFKEKQLALSAVKKAAVNMKCIQLFQDKDKKNCGTIGRRDFQMVMDRIGVLRGMSSREIDAVFKGFSTQTDTEIDYRKFSDACRHAIDHDHRLARMAQK